MTAKDIAALLLASSETKDMIDFHDEDDGDQTSDLVAKHFGVTYKDLVCISTEGEESTDYDVIAEMCTSETENSTNLLPGVCPASAHTVDDIFLVLTNEWGMGTIWARKSECIEFAK